MLRRVETASLYVRICFQIEHLIKVNRVAYGVQLLICRTDSASITSIRRGGLLARPHFHATNQYNELSNLEPPNLSYFSQIRK